MNELLSVSLSGDSLRNGVERVSKASETLPTDFCPPFFKFASGDTNSSSYLCAFAYGYVAFTASKKANQKDTVKYT